jgi:thioester reductase-like protein/aryl carrier-like protein
MIAPTSGAIPSAAGLVEGLKKTGADIAFIVPSIVQELSQNPQLLDCCAKNLKLIVYCGGDLPQSIGDTVSSKIRLLNQYGATEMGLVALTHPKDRDPQDWKYIQFHPAMGAEFRHVTDNEHELHIVRSPEHEPNQMTFTFFSDLDEYPSRDLFVPHPTKANLWKWHARADDIVVFLNGEKTNPISMEQYIASRNPQVSGILVVGTQRFQASLLVEVVSDGKALTPTERAAFIEKMWPSIEEANRDCPAHARVAKTHILFTDPQRPMLRAGKGTVQRAGTLKLYEKELDALYADAETLSTQIDGASGPGRVNDGLVISQFIRDTISSVTKWGELSNTDNVFTLGMDSLQAITVARWLRHGLDMPGITINLIYTNPSVSQLTHATLRLLHEGVEFQKADEGALLQERSRILEEYRAKIDQIPFVSDAHPSRINQTTEKHRVVLTGSTGVLGSYILHALLTNPSVVHVYCLNRKSQSDSLAAQTEKFKIYHLDISPLNSSRVSFLSANLSDGYLGLQPDTFQTLRDTVSLVIHNAWPVNFNLSLASFRPQFDGLVHLVKFCSSSSVSPRLFFISSISSVMSHRTVSKETPEEVITTEKPAPNGYAESKYLAEQLLDYASRKLSVPISFARVGQIAGAARSPGLWNKTEWFPSLVISSRHIGAVPDSLGPILGRIDWVPIDLLAEVLMDLALGETEQGRIRVFHPLNLHSTSWDTIRPAVTDALYACSGKRVETVSLKSWIDKVRNDMETTAGSHRILEDGELQALVGKNPAVKLLSFYEDLSLSTKDPSSNILDTRQTAKSSPKLQVTEGIKTGWIEKWIKEWMNPTPSRVPN